MVGSRREKGAVSARRLGWGPWHPASGGAQAGNGTWCCGCCAASRLMRSREKSVWRSIAWRRGRPVRWPVSSWVCRRRPVSRWPPSWMRPSDTLGSCRWRLSCCGSVPAHRSVASLWRRGGRDDERNDLRDDGAALRSQAGVSNVGAVALGALRAAGSCAAPRAGCWPGAPRADARPVGCATVGGHSQRPGPLPVPGRGPSQGPRAAADPRRHPGLPDAGVAGDARAGATLAAPRAAG